MGNIRIPLEPDKYYHIYNHAVGRDNLFLSDGNFTFFLNKYHQHISPIADTFAYCLMPNHFHFVVRIKENPRPNPQGFENPAGLAGGLGIERFLSQTFGNLFNAYTKAFNKQQHRKGKLFLDNFERKHINDEKYLRNLVHYVHFNPVHHGFVSDLSDWKYSSFNSFFSNKATAINRLEVIKWFDDLENFLAFHHKTIDEKLIAELEYF